MDTYKEGDSVVRITDSFRPIGTTAVLLKRKNDVFWYVKGEGLIEGEHWNEKFFTIDKLRPKIGDTVYHTAHSVGRLVGVITGEDKTTNLDRWEMFYPDSDKTGSWLKKYTKLMPQSEEIQGMSVDKVIVDEVEDNAITNSEPLRKDFPSVIEWEKAYWDWKVKKGAGFREAQIYADKCMRETLDKRINPPIIDYELLGKSLMYMSNYGADKQLMLDKITELTNVTREYFPPVTNKLHPENTMQAELKVTKVNGKTTSTTINDVEVSDMKNDQLIRQIVEAEKRVDELKEIKVDSKSIKKEITRLNKFVKDVATLLDAKK